MYWLVYFGLIIFIVSLALNTIFFFRFTWKSEQSTPRKIAQNVAMSVFSILATLMLLELFFNLVFAQSDAFNQTLAGQNWFKRYWRVNSLGYRDKEWMPEMLAGRTRVMVLGDSFVAGHGINNPEDRFSDVLGQMLGDGYAVLNVGKLGAETKEQFDLARDYPYPPDILVLSFYINDIADTYTSMRVSQPNFVSRPPPLAADSYAVNFFYWRIYRLGPHEWSNNYWDWLRGLYNDPLVWQAYREVLLEIIEFTREKDIKLVVVVFPNLLAIEESQPITSKVVNLFQEEGIPVVDVARLVAGQEPKSLVVNAVDWHPNESVHRLVAEALYQLIHD
ncbi:MAG: SGNH/GDSL hydrolase family protein [Anaerolineae bacterium]|nr:SGNH/GDSL hydrolase family protein [Anaerolineae bacterium]